MDKKDMLYSYYTIRKLIGFLGVLLPIAVVLGYGELLASISHYYYTRSAVFFISILTAFGFFLISYRGYPRDKATERLSDNIITHIGGFAILIVVLIPTDCMGSDSSEITAMCNSGHYPLFGHNNHLKSTIHLISAGIFLVSMGWMAFFRFTKGVRPDEKWKNVLYRTSAIIMWASVLILLIEFLIKKHFTNYDVFILETVSVFAFGTSWLVKGQAIKDIIVTGRRLLNLK